MPSTFDLYLAETTSIAQTHKRTLDEAARVLEAGRVFSHLEQNGLLHTLQVLVENAIGKSKHTLKALNQPIPPSAYDSFEALAQLGQISSNQLTLWNAIIGLRNRIVHDYMNIDMPLIYRLVRQRGYQFIIDFLQQKPQLKSIGRK
jgi:uncharacterized protein YutE (UPF0331/DUF86 family)